MSTRNFVPRANEEGNIGTSLKRWLKGWFKYIFVSDGITDGSNTVNISDVSDAVAKKHSASTQFNQSISGEINGLTEKTIPVDNDSFLLEDSASLNVKKKTLWLDIKIVIKSYFDGIYLTIANAAATYVTQSGSITQIATRNHSDLQNKNSETDIKHVTDNEKNSLDNANSPSTSNPVATQNDISSTQGSSDTVSSTTSGTYQTKLTVNFTPPVTGNYLIMWNCELSNSTNLSSGNLRIREGSTTIAGECEVRTDAAAGTYQPCSGIAIRALTALTSYSYTIEYNAAANTESIRNARIAIRRIG